MTAKSLGSQVRNSSSSWGVWMSDLGLKAGCGHEYSSIVIYYAPPNEGHGRIGQFDCLTPPPNGQLPLAPPAVFAAPGIKSGWRVKSSANAHLVELGASMASHGPVGLLH